MIWHDQHDQDPTSFSRAKLSCNSPSQCPEYPGSEVVTEGKLRLRGTCYGVIIFIIAEFLALQSRSILLLLLALLFPSCSPQQSSSQASAAKDVLTILTWEEYFPPEVLEEFEDNEDILLEVITYENSEHFYGLMLSQPERYDVVVIDDHAFRILQNLRLLADLDHSQLTNFSNLGHYKGQKFDPENRFSIPYLWGTTLLTYDAELVKRPPTSWNDLWDPQVVGNEMVAMLMEPSELFAVAMLKLGHPTSSSDEHQIAEARDTLLAQFDSVNLRYLTEIEIIEHLEEGVCAAAMLYSGDYTVASEENPNLEAIIPEEGATLWMDNFCISQESDNKELAYRFIDFMIDAEVAKECAEWNWYASPNEAAEKLLDPELLSDKTVYPPAGVLAKCSYLETSEERQRLIGLYMRPIKDRAKDVSEFLTAE